MIKILDLRGSGNAGESTVGQSQKLEMLFKKVSDLEKEVNDLKKMSRPQNNISINE